MSLMRCDASLKESQPDKCPVDFLVKWVNTKETNPPDRHRSIDCSMYLISNDGFVTIGFWYPYNGCWFDADHKVNITNQVRYWMELPESPGYDT